VAVAEERSVPAGAKGPGPGPQALGFTGLARRAVRGFLTLREGSVIVVTLVTIVYFIATTENFATVDNFKNLLPYFAPFAILGAAEVFVMINAEIDLSIGAVYLFAPFIFQKLAAETGLPLVPALIVTLIVCMAVGAINGFFVAVVGIASFVVTLGMLFGLEGLTLVISHAQQVPMPGTSVTSVGSFAQVFGGGTYSELIWALGIVVVLQVILSYTRWGLYTVSVGDNRLGAAEAGIKVHWNLIRNFMLCATLAGFVGLLEAVRTTTATPDPSGANEVLFEGISAAVIGGTLLAGGSGTVVGALIGAVFLGVLNDGLIIKGVNAEYLFLYTGIAILIAMTLNVFVQRVRTGGSRA
jgi:simple sugar transport system permease protein